MHWWCYWPLHRLLHWIVHWLLHLRVDLLLHWLMHGLLHWLRVILRGANRLWLYLRGVRGSLMAVKLIVAWLRVNNLWSRCRRSGLYKRLRLGQWLRIGGVQSNGRLLIQLALFDLFSRTRWLILALAATNDDNNSSSNKQNTNDDPSNEPSAWAWRRSRTGWGTWSVGGSDPTTGVLEGLLHFHIEKFNPIRWKWIALSGRGSTSRTLKNYDAIFRERSCRGSVSSVGAREDAVWVDLHHEYVLSVADIDLPSEDNAIPRSSSGNSIANETGAIIVLFDPFYISGWVHFDNGHLVYCSS